MYQFPELYEVDEDVGNKNVYQFPELYEVDEDVGSKNVSIYFAVFPR